MKRTFENIKYPLLFPEKIDDHFEEIRNMEIRPDDIFMASYPRSGMHWTRQIVKMLNTGKVDYHEDVQGKEIIDFSPISSFKSQKSPRLIITHLPSKYLPKDITKCRLLYVSRNPKDVVVSQYFLQRDSKYTVSSQDWTPYLQDYMEGESYYGPWFDHACGYFSLAHERDNIQIVKYEDLKRDLKKGVKQIADFLAVPYDETLINDIAEACDFKSLKANRERNITEEIKT